MKNILFRASFIKGKVRDIVEMSLTNDCTKSLEK